MKLSKLFFVALLSGSFIVSCSVEEEPIVEVKEPVVEKPFDPDYDKGILVLNEGSAGQGSVSYISNDLQTFVQNAYRVVNPTDLMGKYAQNIFFDGNKAFIIAGGSNKITVVDRNTFKIIGKVEGDLVNPRYGVVVDGKAYVTNANTYFSATNINGNTDDYIAVINLSTYEVESKIKTNTTANRIVLENGKLYVTEPYNSDKLVIVNPKTSAVENVTIGSDADSMEVKNGVLYIMKSTFGMASEILKVQLSNNAITKIAFPADFQGAKNLDIEDNKIYYTKGTSVYGMNLTDSNASATPILTYESTSKWGKMYGFAARNNQIFVADGGDFTANSKVFIYSISGSLLKDFTVGVGPNGFYFND